MMDKFTSAVDSHMGSIQVYGWGEAHRSNLSLWAHQTPMFSNRQSTQMRAGVLFIYRGQWLEGIAFLS